MKQFSECFEDLPDPRADNALHDLTELLFIALMATLCGATSCVDMALFARMKAYLWQDVLVLKHGLPSHDTFSRVFRMLDPEAFEVAFRRFMKAFAEGARIERPYGVVALDGKALRRGYERGKSHMPPVMVTAWAAQTRMALANVLAPDNNEAAGGDATHRAYSAQGLRGHGRCAALPSRHGQRDHGAGRRLCSGSEGEPACPAGRGQGRDRAPQAQSASADHDRRADHGRKERRKHWLPRSRTWRTQHDFPGLKAVARITASAAATKPSSATS